MKRDLRESYLSSAAAHAVLAGICDVVWQGDFGKGISTGSGVWSDPGANPCVPYGPVPAAGVSGQGNVQPQFRVGMVVTGDYGAEFVLGKLVLASATDLLPGQAYQLDKDYIATLLTTGNSVLNEEVVIGQIWAPQLAVGTYYIWFQRSGRAAVQAAAASVATGSGETTATAGVLKFPASATAATKSVGPATAYQASSGITFTGTTVNGSPYITNVQSVSGGATDPLRDLTLGQVITGTGMPANAIIAAIDKLGPGGTWRVTIGTNTAGSYATLQNATAGGAGVTFTVTNMITCNLDWPTLNKQN